MAAFLHGFSELHNEILVMLAADDLVSAHQRWTGSHDGEFLGIGATGRPSSSPRPRCSGSGTA